MKNLAVHRLLRWNGDDNTNSHYLTYTLTGRFKYFLNLGVKGLTSQFFSLSFPLMTRVTRFLACNGNRIHPPRCPSRHFVSCELRGLGRVKPWVALLYSSQAFSVSSIQDGGRDFSACSPIHLLCRLPDFNWVALVAVFSFQQEQRLMRCTDPPPAHNKPTRP